MGGSPYFFEPTKQHMVVLVFPKKSVDINYLKTLISDHHSREHSNKIYEITAMLLGLDQHIIMIKQFEGAQKSQSYLTQLINNEKIKTELKKSDFRAMPISLENFSVFYKNRDMEGYYNFYLNYYSNNY